MVIHEVLGRRRSARPIAECCASQSGRVIAFPNASFQADPQTAAAQRQMQGLFDRST
jgi:hypothetical protein